MTLAEAVVVLALIAITGFAAVAPTAAVSRRVSNERRASLATRVLSEADADFRANDRDGNHVNDFWTADVYGLYGLVPIPSGATTLLPDTDDEAQGIRLIDRSLALADAYSSTDFYSNVHPVCRGGPWHGYLVGAFQSEEVGEGPRPLANDTDGPAFFGSCHDRDRFAFMAFPSSLSEGTLAFVINEDNSPWKYNLPPTWHVTSLPIRPRDDSRSRTQGSGVPCFDNATVFPISPGAVGCSHWG